MIWHSGLARGAEAFDLWVQLVPVFTCTDKECRLVSLGLIVFNSKLKIMSASTNLLITYNKVREGCFYLSKMHSFEKAYTSVTSSFFELGPVKFSEELSG